MNKISNYAQLLVPVALLLVLAFVAWNEWDKRKAKMDAAAANRLAEDSAAPAAATV